MKAINKLRGIKKAKKRIKFVIENKEALLSEKKAIIKSNVKGVMLTQANVDRLNLADKSNVKYKPKSGEAIVRFIGNTYLWLDNHEDVHDKGVFKKTIKERTGKIFHLADHKYGVLSKLGDVLEIQEIKVSWRDLNIDKDGDTVVLLITSLISETKNKAIYNEYVSKKANQHSVGMWYVEIKLAINSPAEKEEYTLWLKYIDKLGNTEKANSLGYFFLIKEAGLREVSYVLEASNELTPTTDIEESEEDKEDKALMQIQAREDAIKKFLS